MAYAGEASAAMDGADFDWGEFAVESPGLVPMGLSNDVQAEPGSDGSEDGSSADIDDASLDTGETFVEPNMGGTGDDSDIDPQYYSGDVWLSNGQWHTFTFTLSENLLIKLNISQWSNFTWGDVYDCELTDSSGHLYAGWPIKYNQYNKKYGYIALPRGTYHLKVHAIGHSNRTRRISLSYDTLTMPDLNVTPVEREFNDKQEDANPLTDHNGAYGSLYNPWYAYNGDFSEADYYSIQLNASSNIHAIVTGYQKQSIYSDYEYVNVALFNARGDVVHMNNDDAQDLLACRSIYMDQDSVSGDARSVCGFDTGVLPAGTYYLAVYTDSVETFGDAYGLYVEVAPASAPATFKDVPAGTWYQPWVKYASSNGLMTGLKDDLGGYSGYFDPDAQLTRAQVATVLWRAAGSPSQGSSKFPDTVKGSWYDEAVAWCVSAGVVTGYTSGPDKGCFRPDRAVTREELATMVWRFAKTQGVDVSNPDPAKFNATVDHASVSSFAVEPLKWTAAAGIMGGVDYGNGKFGLEPQGTATRAQAAKVFSVLARDILSGKVQVPTVGKCTITFNTNGGSAVKSQTVKPGGKVTKPANPTKTGHTFTGWYSDKGCKTAFNFNTQVKSNITLYAKWEKLPPVYCVLYADGLLSLQRGADTDNSHGKVIGKWEGLGGSYSRPWDGYEEKVRNVVVRDPIELPADSSRLFSGLKNCASMDVTKLDVSKVTNMADMFHGCSSLTSLDVSGWDVSHVTDFSDVFEDCRSLASLDVSQWNVSSTTWMFGTFYGCESLTSLDVSGWDVSKVTDMEYVFGNCFNLISLNIAGWDTSGVEEANSFASYAGALDKVTVGPKFTLGEYLPDGPWYDESGKSWDTVPSGVGGTFSKTRPSGNKTASEAPNLEEVDAPAGIGPENDKNLADVAVTRGVTDSGLEYAMVPEGAVDAAGEAYALDREYAELGGRCVGAGVYVTAYRGEATDLALPAQIGGVDVVSADLSWKGDAQAGISDPEGRTRLESLSLERGCGLASLDASGSDVAGIELAGDEALGGLPALRFLDLSGTRVPSLDPTSMPALERLALRGCPLGADSLASLTTWSGATGLPADLEGAGAKDEPSEPEQPGEPANPDQPAEPEQPSKPANPDQPAEPEQPSNPAEPAVPGEPEQSAEPATPDQPSEPSEPAVPGESEQPAEPVGPADSSEPVTSGDPAIPAELSESVDLGHISALPTGVTRIEESAA